MANPRSLVYALYTHWDTVEVLVRLSREFAVLTTEQVLGCITKVAPQLDAEAQGAALRAMVNADILQSCAHSTWPMPATARPGAINTAAITRCSRRSATQSAGVRSKGARSCH